MAGVPVPRARWFGSGATASPGEARLQLAEALARQYRRGGAPAPAQARPPLAPPPQRPPLDLGQADPYAAILAAQVEAEAEAERQRVAAVRAAAEAERAAAAPAPQGVLGAERILERDLLGELNPATTDAAGELLRAQARRKAEELGGPTPAFWDWYRLKAGQVVRHHGGSPMTAREQAEHRVGLDEALFPAGRSLDLSVESLLRRGLGRDVR